MNNRAEKDTTMVIEVSRAIPTGRVVLAIAKGTDGAEAMEAWSHQR